MKRYYLMIFTLLINSCNFIQKTASDKDPWIKPWENNPAYWQYKGQPVLLLGATNHDNLFQKNNLKSHLDSLKAIGGNYIRNTLSDRDPGDHRAFAMTAEGKYDLIQWNDEYWMRFENILRITSDRDIIVQIEIWDRHDHRMSRWISNPYNPKNNINYTYSESGLDSLSPNILILDNSEILLDIQKAFVEKILSISLKYDHVLYCIDNETIGPHEWGIFWTEFIQEIAHARGKEIFITQMWNHGSYDVKVDIHNWFDHPEKYRYVELSQNTHNPGRLNWDNSQYVIQYIQDHPRPVNNTKIYGSDDFERWLDRGMTTVHAIQTFCRNILGGFASSRFHRPPHGLGLSEPSVNTIKTFRKIEEHVKMWEITPRMDLLPEVEDNQAYLSAKEGDKYVLYFTNGNKVNLDLRNHHEEFIVRWISTDDAQWGSSDIIRGGEVVNIEPHYNKSSFAVLLRNQ